MTRHLPRHGWRWRRWSSWLVVASVATSHEAPAWGAEAPPEALVKAAIVFNVLRFVDWPDARSAGVRLGVCGDDRTADALLALDGRRAGTFTLHVSRLVGAAGADSCDAIYLAAQPAADRSRRLRAVAERGVLTFGDAPAFLDEGGMVQLTLRQERVHIRMVPERLKAARLRMPAQVLQLVEIVHAR